MGTGLGARVQLADGPVTSGPGIVSGNDELCIACQCVNVRRGLQRQDRNDSL